MWGLSNRALRLSDRKRFVRAAQIGVARVVVRGAADHATVEIQGEVDFTCSEEVFRAVMKLPQRIVSIDLSLLDFVDSAGVRAIRMLIARLGERNNTTIHVHGVNETIRRTFDLVPVARVATTT